MNILLTLAYDGTNYCGWQSQQNGDTVQERLEKALSDVYGREITVLGASRTDAGVHAAGQRACFSIEDGAQKIPLDKLPEVINTRLPEDIVVTYAERVSGDFHPIAGAKRKTYEYKILNQRYPDPKLNRFVCHIYLPLDFEGMRQAARHFQGTHDFSGFAASGGHAKTTVRTIYEIELIKRGNEILLYITGSGFLYNMVRIIAGTLIEVGSGKIRPEEIPDIIESRDRKRAGRTAPPCGLTLIEAVY